MACAARGYPDPRVTIKKETSTVPITLTSGLLNATFSVAQLKASDSGKYICIAENVASVMRKEVVVTVKCKLFRLYGVSFLLLQPFVPGMRKSN